MTTTTTTTPSSSAAGAGEEEEEAVEGKPESSGSGGGGCGSGGGDRWDSRCFVLKLKFDVHYTNHSGYCSDPGEIQSTDTVETDFVSLEDAKREGIEFNDDSVHEDGQIRALAPLRAKYDKDWSHGYCGCPCWKRVKSAKIVPRMKKWWTPTASCSFSTTPPRPVQVQLQQQQQRPQQRPPCFDEKTMSDRLLVIKARVRPAAAAAGRAEELRRFPLPKLSWTAFLAEVKSAIGQVPSLVQYHDMDGDLCTITREEEFQEAVRCRRLKRGTSTTDSADVLFVELALGPTAAAAESTATLTTTTTTTTTAGAAAAATGPSSSSTTTTTTTAADTTKESKAVEWLDTLPRAATIDELRAVAVRYGMPAKPTDPSPVYTHSMENGCVDQLATLIK